MSESIAPGAGSPPPMRGKVLGLRTSGLLPRITPAYAGKSHSKRTREKINGDHPRLCGEKAVVGNYNRIFVGSPPPMRGKVREFLFFRFIFGITPAYAGKSDKMLDRLACHEDHPRLCGEKKWFMTKKTFMAGSPPPMRGKGCFSGSLAP